MADVDRDFLIKIAKLYYHGGCSQEQIAKILNLSRPKVARMLERARSQKIVQFHISDSSLHISEMEQKLKEYLDVDNVIIVRSNRGLLLTQQNAGRAAGEYLDRYIFDGIKIGISWGGTMDAMVSQFKLSKPVNNAVVFQLVGGTPSSSFGIDSRMLTIKLANKLNAEYSLIQSPQYVSSKTVKDTLMKEPEIVNHFKLLNELDLAVIGISSKHPENSAPYKAGYITLEQSRELVENGYATDICGNRIYIDGSFRDGPLSDRLMAITPEQLRAIPQVVAVATGEERASNIVSVAKGRFINTLITDEIAAIAILGSDWK